MVIDILLRNMTYFNTNLRDQFFILSRKIHFALGDDTFFLRKKRNVENCFFNSIFTRHIFSKFKQRIHEILINLR